MLYTSRSWPVQDALRSGISGNQVLCPNGCDNFVSVHLQTLLVEGVPAREQGLPATVEWRPVVCRASLASIEGKFVEIRAQFSLCTILNPVQHWSRLKAPEILPGQVTNV